MKGQSPNHWTTRNAFYFFVFCVFFFFFLFFIIYFLFFSLPPLLFLSFFTNPSVEGCLSIDHSQGAALLHTKPQPRRRSSTNGLARSSPWTCFLFFSSIPTQICPDHLHLFISQWFILKMHFLLTLKNCPSDTSVKAGDSVFEQKEHEL